MRLARGVLAIFVLTTFLSLNSNFLPNAQAANQAATVKTDNSSDSAAVNSTIGSGTVSNKTVITSCKDLLAKLTINDPAIKVQPARVVKCQENLSDDISQPMLHTPTFIKGIVAVIEFNQLPIYDKQTGTINDFIKSGKTVYGPCADELCHKISGTAPYTKNVDQLYWVNNAPRYISNLAFSEPNQSVIGSADSCSENVVRTYKFTDITTKQAVGFDCSSSFASSGNFAKYDDEHQIWNKSHDQGQKKHEFVLGFSVTSLLPDYQISGTPAFQTIDKDGVVSAAVSSKAKINAKTSKIKFTGLSVVNNGAADATEKSTTTVSIFSPKSSATLSDLTIPALKIGESVPIEVDVSLSRIKTDIEYLIKNDPSAVGFGVSVLADSTQKIVETNEGNNYEQYRSAYVYPGLEVITVNSSGLPVMAQFRLVTNGEGFEDIKTNSDGLFLSVPLDDPNPAIVFTAQPVVNGEHYGDKQTVTIKDYSIYKMTLIVDVSSNNLPDLSISLDNAKLTTKTATGKTSTVALMDKVPINYGDDVVEMTISGVEISNIGSVDIPAGSIGGVYLDIKGGQQIGISRADETNKVLEAGQNIKLSDTVFAYKTNGLLEVFNDIISSSSASSSDWTYRLKFIAELDGMDEVDSSNNTVESNAWLEMIIISTSAKDTTGKPVANAQIRLTDTTTIDPSTGKNKVYTALTGGSGEIKFMPVGSLIDKSKRTFNIELILDGKTAASLTNKEITKNGYYSYDLTLTGSSIIINVKVGSNTTENINYTSATGGKVSLDYVPPVGSGGKTVLGFITLTADIVDGQAVFTKEKFPNMKDGTYRLTSSTGQFKYMRKIRYTDVSESGSYKQIEMATNYNWPETTSGESLSGAPTFNFTSSSTVSATLEMNIKKYCENDASIGVKFCWYDDDESITQSKLKVLPVLKAEIARYQKWTDFPLNNLSDVTITELNDQADWVGLYSPDKNSIALDDGGLLAIATLSGANYGTQTVIDHEMFHALDHSYAPAGASTVSRETAEYVSSVSDQFLDVGGARLWDISSMNCTYQKYCTAGYDSKYFLSRPNIVEAFAEEHSTVCVNGSKVESRLNNIDKDWSKYSSEVLPSNISQLKNMVIQRLQGKNADGAIYSTKLNAWYNQCVSTTK